MILPPNSIIASGPIIIEENKILLNRENKPEGITPWMIPGGEMEDFDATLEDTCKREAKEEMGIEIEILKPMSPMIIKLAEKQRVIVLIHYLAKRLTEISPGPETAEWAWHDINNLPENCTINVYNVVKEFKNMI